MDACQSLTEMLRGALNQLYDPVFLQGSALVQLFGLADRTNPAEALQSLLTQGIRSLKPPSYSPETCKAHRYYQVLFYRYVQQYTQLDVANKVGLSARHLRREQDAAIGALASHLQTQYRLPQEPAPPEVESILDAAAVTMTGTSLDPTHEPLMEHSTDISSVLETILRLTANLAQSYAVTVRSQATGTLPRAAIPKTTCKPLILDLLTPAIRAVPGGEVVMAALAQEGRVTLRLTARPAPGAELAVGWDTESLIVPRDLARAFGGQVALHANSNELWAELSFPEALAKLVLAIEDNPDTLQLWTRYLLGTPFQLVGLTDPALAVATAAKLKPAILILDVMMPGMDGWELLGRLQYHPDTRHIPVIVCTVHPQRELALSLGARDFVAKPTTRRAFLSALEEQISAVARQTPQESPA